MALRDPLGSIESKGGGGTARLAWAVLLGAGLAGTAHADTQVFEIDEDPRLDRAVAAARDRFLAMKPYVSRLDVVLLTPDGSGKERFLRGSHGPDAIAYPASVVKLAYLASAMHWCSLNGQPYTYLDASVGPMIADSSNWATGVVVDAITGAPNYPTTTNDATFQAWLAARRFTRDFLDSRSLLENQTVLHKTYPTNSGASPSGAELLAINLEGGNRMQPKPSADTGQSREPILRSFIAATPPSPVRCTG